VKLGPRCTLQLSGGLKGRGNLVRRPNPKSETIREF
jgi:hypothetical protein